MSHSSRVLRLCHPELCSYKTHTLSSLFTTCTVKKLALFYEIRFGRISLNISLSDSVLETEILQAKVLNLTAELPHFVNYCGLWTLSMVRYFWELESCSANQIIWTFIPSIIRTDRYSPLLTFHFILICFFFLYLIITHQVLVQSSFPCMSHS